MLTSLHKNRSAQVVLGLLFGICFGFLLQKGGVTTFSVIEGQLLLTDFTVIKLMLSAVIVGMAGFHLLKHFGHVQSHAAPGTIGSNVVGGLIFGIGFALLGYCPGRSRVPPVPAPWTPSSGAWSGCSSVRASLPGSTRRCVRAS